MIRALIMWMVRRRIMKAYSDEHPPVRQNWPITIVAWRENMGRSDPERQVVARRYQPFLMDEHSTRVGNKVWWKLPWWAPCNALLHHWRTHEDVQMHDHQRWSITIVLRGQIVEKTPWGEQTLRAGAVVFRSQRYIHGFRLEREHSARTWTLFIVGRRTGVQNTFDVKRQFERPRRGPDLPEPEED